MAESKKYQVRCPRENGFWRCGVKWTAEWQDVPAGFTPAQIERLSTEPAIQIRETPSADPEKSKSR